MKKPVKVFASLFLVCVLSAFCSAQIYAETIIVSDGFSYTLLNDNYISVCDWEGGSDILVIPEKIDGSKVKEISSWAFSEREDFSGVDFSKADYLDTIGTMAFKNCRNIAGNLNIPAQVKTIKLGAFQGCDSVTNLYYNTRAAIPEQGFYSCSGLEKVSLGDGVTSIGRLAFANCEALNYVRIPESVTSIEDYAFKDSHNIIIYCYRDSYALEYAVENELEYYILDPMYGDSNADGKVNILDVTAIQKYKIGEQELSEYGMRCADVNHDGSITVRDATLIQMKLAKYDVDF